MGIAVANSRKPVDDLYCERVLRARRMSAAEKLSAGFQLFEYACEITRAGIRHQFPAASEAEVERTLKERLAQRQRMEIGQWTSKK